MARTTRLTPEIIDAIVERIAVGVFPYVAAASIGIPKSTYYDWLARGRKGHKPFSELSDKVRRAQAQARVVAELRVYRENPLAWLRLGPGREDWCERAHVAIEGRVAHGKEGSLSDSPAPCKVRPNAFALFQEMGLIEPTERGRCLFERQDPHP